jgi:hypothetical protein
MDIIIWPFTYGLFISALAVIVYFGLLAKQRRNGVLVPSEIVILALAVITLISTYLAADLYVSLLNYLQNPPPYRIPDSHTMIFEVYFRLTCLPLFITTIFLLLAYIGQRLRMTNKVQG